MQFYRLSCATSQPWNTRNRTPMNLNIRSCNKGNKRRRGLLINSLIATSVCSGSSPRRLTIYFYVTSLFIIYTIVPKGRCESDK